ncbi:hypothetical protein HPB52_000353 [Rhipicephalus sanguineus]|uniref:Uncharacterized protein n=1 Tax=Rhipicephalus sanguineus TaxID=34632 RepID=A0A9D4T844_RHISA|nr:hypothetical protein HPB52_000353 [Rhipicephalus sanguineus]
MEFAAAGASATAASGIAAATAKSNTADSVAIPGAAATFLGAGRRQITADRAELESASGTSESLDASDQYSPIAFGSRVMRSRGVWHFILHCFRAPPARGAQMKMRLVLIFL